MTWLGILNFCILQWFCVRLGKRKIITNFEVTGFSSMPNRKMGTEGIINSYRYEYTIMKWIVPLTGWWSDYKWIGKK